MADMRRRSPESPPGIPQIQFKPGLADEMLRDLAPLLAEDGIDVDNIDVPDLDTLQHALNRAVERRNMQLFSPVGTTRDIALTTLRLTVEAILDGDTARAGTLLDQVQPSRRTTRSPPSPAASGSPSGCSMTGSPGKPSTHPPNSANALRCPPGIGTANAPQPTSWFWRAKDGRSARWTKCSHGTAAHKSSPAPHSH